MEIEYDDVNQIVIATKFGPAGITEIIEFINAGVTLGEKHKCYKILFSMQEAKETASFLESYEFHKNLIKMTSLTMDHCCAVVFSPLENKNEKKFYETIAANWGQSIFRTFIDREKGFEWLKLQKTKAKSHSHQ